MRQQVVLAGTQRGGEKKRPQAPFRREKGRRRQKLGGNGGERGGFCEKKARNVSLLDKEKKKGARP